MLCTLFHQNPLITNKNVIFSFFFPQNQRTGGQNGSCLGAGTSVGGGGYEERV
jgi:hypothetical protein